MASKVLVLNGHPGHGTFCGALAEAYARGAEASGREVRRLHLGDMDFDPDMRSGHGEERALEPCLAELQEALRWCDHFVLVHPLWWGSLPAKLKGALDRALLPGFAFRYKPGLAVPVPLLAGRSAQVLVTADTPVWYLYLLDRAPGYRMLRRQVLALCGFRPVRFNTFSPLQGSSESRRRDFLAEAERLGRRA